jgi:hypothetical protein
MKLANRIVELNERKIKSKLEKNNKDDRIWDKMSSDSSTLFSVKN